MEGPFLSPPAKRPFSNVSSGMQENNIYDTNGGESKRNRPKTLPPPIVLSSGQVAFRLLCPVSKIGGVIGKSGTVIKLLQQETGAKIRIEESISPCEERIVLIVAPESPNKIIALKGSTKEENVAGEEYEVSPAQHALVRVFEKVLEVDAESVTPANGVIFCRLLAVSSQVGSLMGKGGKNIENIRKQSGSKIRVLSAEQLPACASPTDELIQIMGDILAVKKALLAVSRCLQDCPPVDKSQMVGSRPLDTVYHGTFPNPREELLSNRSSFLPPVPNSSGDFASRGHPVFPDVDRIPTLDTQNNQPEVVFRLLCSNDKVGGVIGKGGSIVKTLQNETGATISVGASVPESDERVITISAIENVESRNSPAQHAVIRVFTRSVEAGIENGLEFGSSKELPISARLLIQSSQVGCLMGKGGKIISEMRKAAGVGIRILGGDQVPKCAAENDEVVQINGRLENVQDALFHVTGRLRDSLFPNKISNGALAGRYSSFDIPEISPFSRAREPTSPGLYTSDGLSHKFDRQATLTGSFDHLGHSYSLDRPLSPRLWAPQTGTGMNSRGVSDIERGATTLKGGRELGSGSKSAIVMNTTVEIVVPENAIGFVYGENGGNLNRLRQISGAKVVVHDPQPGRSDGVVIISGTPDQTQAAQSLLHAFILTG